MMLQTVFVLGLCLLSLVMSEIEDGDIDCRVDSFPATAGITIDEFDGEKFNGLWKAHSIKFGKWSGLECTVAVGRYEELFEKNITCHYNKDNDAHKCRGPIQFEMTVDFDDGTFWLDSDVYGSRFLEGLIIHQDDQTMAFYHCGETKADGTCKEAKKHLVIVSKNNALAQGATIPQAIQTKLDNVCVAASALHTTSGDVC